MYNVECGRDWKWLIQTILSVLPNFGNLLPDLIQPDKKIITKCLTFAPEIFSIRRFLAVFLRIFIKFVRIVQKNRKKTFKKP